jgi:hypothetical protein
MKIKKNPLTIAALTGAAIVAIFLVVNTYLTITAPSREADQLKGDMDKIYRDLDKATEERKRKEAGR